MTTRRQRSAHETEVPSAAVGLVRPTLERLPAYVSALERGWSADNLRGEAAIRDELARIAEDAEAFVVQQTDREAGGREVTLPDGSKVARIPGFQLWIWDGDFCGAISLRWQPGSLDLPPHGCHAGGGPAGDGGKRSGEPPAESGSRRFDFGVAAASRSGQSVLGPRWFSYLEARSCRSCRPS